MNLFVSQYEVVFFRKDVPEPAMVYDSWSISP